VGVAAATTTHITLNGGNFHSTAVRNTKKKIKKQINTRAKWVTKTATKCQKKKKKNWERVGESGDLRHPKLPHLST